MDLLSLFNMAFEYARKFLNDSVLTYATKRTLELKVHPDNWQLYEGILLHAVLAEPSMLPVIARIFQDNASLILDTGNITTTISELCRYHAALQEGFEVAWALWIAKILGLKLSQSVGESVSSVQDSIVALVALDLSYSGSLDGLNVGFWKSFTTLDELYSTQWLLAYEAGAKRWLPAKDDEDYIAQDEFFSEMRSAGVSFYNTEETESYEFFYTG